MAAKRNLGPIAQMGLVSGKAAHTPKYPSLVPLCLYITVDTVLVTATPRPTTGSNPTYPNLKVWATNVLDTLKDSSA